MTSQTPGYRLYAIAPAVLDDVRRSGLDVSGTPVEYRTATGGEPLRCCLRDAAAGADIMLFGYEPPLPRSPYREIGAVFAHAAPCDGPPVRYSPDWYGRPQVLRAYDRDGRIHPATRVHEGSAPEAVIAEMLADPGVAQIHSRNVAYGCFMFGITRAD